MSGPCQSQRALSEINWMAHHQNPLSDQMAGRFMREISMCMKRCHYREQAVSALLAYPYWEEKE